MYKCRMSCDQQEDSADDDNSGKQLRQDADSHLLGKL